MLASVEVTSRRPLCVEPYSDSKTLGRFILRQKGTTLAIGMITEVFDA
jgi:elongation factor 1 alpha-like protein